MNDVITIFRDNISRIRKNIHIYNQLHPLTHTTIDLSDMLRAQIVLIVSALDHYFHEAIRVRMCEIMSSDIAAPPNYPKFQISLNDHFASHDSAGVEWLDTAIRREHSWRSFQDGDEIAKVVKYIYDGNIWEGISRRMPPLTNADIKRKLSLIVKRRNQIAHEADLNHLSPGARWPIDVQDVIDAVDFIESVIENTHKEITGAP